MKNTVALIGKPNVGKSTLFNRMIGKRQSIVYDKPGVTRDRIYQKVSWLGHDFYVIDTGGITDEKKIFVDDIRAQAKVAIEEADLVVFVVDGLTPITKEDFLVIDILRKSNKRIILAINKMENNKEFDSSIYSLGIKDDTELTEMLAKINPAIESEKAKGTNLEEVEGQNLVSRQNALNMVEAVRRGSEELREMEAQGKVKIVAAMFDLETGHVEFL